MGKKGKAGKGGEGGLWVDGGKKKRMGRKGKEQQEGRKLKRNANIRDKVEL